MGGRVHLDILLGSIRHCQEKKGLDVYAWVVMTNHLHMIVGSKTGTLSDTIRNFKKYTSTQIANAIRENPRESRKRWMLWLFKQEESVWFCEEGHHPEEVRTKDSFDSKANYIHLNPLRAGIVEKEEG